MNDKTITINDNFVESLQNDNDDQVIEKLLTLNNSSHIAYDLLSNDSDNYLIELKKIIKNLYNKAREQTQQYSNQISVNTDCIKSIEDAIILKNSAIESLKLDIQQAETLNNDSIMVQVIQIKKNTLCTVEAELKKLTDAINIYTDVISKNQKNIESTEQSIKKYKLSYKTLNAILDNTKLKNHKDESYKNKLFHNEYKPKDLPELQKTSKQYNDDERYQAQQLLSQCIRYQNYLYEQVTANTSNNNKKQINKKYYLVQDIVDILNTKSTDKNHLCVKDKTRLESAMIKLNEYKSQLSSARTNNFFKKIFFSIFNTKGADFVELAIKTQKDIKK